MKNLFRRGNGPSSNSEESKGGGKQPGNSTLTLLSCSSPVTCTANRFLSHQHEPLPAGSASTAPSCPAALCQLSLAPFLPAYQCDAALLQKAVPAALRQLQGISESQPAVGSSPYPLLQPWVSCCAGFLSPSLGKGEGRLLLLGPKRELGTDGAGEPASSFPVVPCRGSGVAAGDEGCWRLPGRGGTARGLWVSCFPVRWVDEGAPVHPHTAPLASHPLASAPTHVSILLGF